MENNFNLDNSVFNLILSIITEIFVVPMYYYLLCDVKRFYYNKNNKNNFFVHEELAIMYISTMSIVITNPRLLNVLRGSSLISDMQGQTNIKIHTNVCDANLEARN